MDFNPSATHISVKDMKDTSSDNLAQALRFATSVKFEDPRGGMGTTTIQMRGFGSSRMGFYLDGIPIMDGYSRNTDYGHFVTQGISSVQISKGFTSPVYGINALGGAVNLVSARPQKELEINFRQRLIFGRHSSPDELWQGFGIGSNVGKFYFSADISHTDKTTYPLSSSFKGKGMQPVGDQKNAYYNNKTAKLKVGIQPNENHEYSLNFMYSRGKKDGRHPEDGGPQWRFPNYDRKTIYLLGNSFFTPDLSLNTRLYYDSSYTRKTQDLCVRADGTLDYRYSGTYDGTNAESRCNPNNSFIYDDESYGAILTLSYDFTQDSNLKFGTNLRVDHHDGTTIQAQPKIDDLKELTSSIFAQYAQRISVFRFVLAASYDRLDGLDAYSYDSSKTNFKESSEKTNIKGSVGLQGALYYDISEAQSLHFSVSKKQNMPTMSTRYGSIWGNYAENTDLKPEGIIGYELGYNLNFDSTRLSVAAFYNDKTDMIKSIEVDEQSTAAAVTACDYPSGQTGATGRYFCYKYVNVDTGYNYGGEIAIEQGFFDDDMLVLGANYSYIQEKSTAVAGGNPGTRITGYPNHIFHAKAAFKPLKSLEFIGLITLESPQYWWNNSIKYYKDPNYFTFDLAANYELVKGLSLNVGVTNLTDRDNYTKWASPLESRQHFAGRRWFAGFEYKY